MLHTLSRRFLVALAGAGSAAVLAGAYASQYIGGLAPCPLCLWQRWPHFAAVLVALLVLTLPIRGLPVRVLMWLGALAALTTAAIGAYHVGVEQAWWEGLASCSGGSISGISMDDLLNPNTNVAPPVRCDEVAWSVFGISMAGWNVLASLGFAAIWALAATRKA